MNEKCNHDVYERLAVADTMCIICLQDHIHILEKEFEKWWLAAHSRQQKIIDLLIEERTYMVFDRYLSDDHWDKYNKVRKGLQKILDES